MLPSESKARKNMPMARGLLYYFPDALAAVAEHSRKGNDKHNPGESLHWSRDKSTDHADCVVRHVVDAGPNWTEVDPEFDTLYAVEVAWRALAMAQIALERRAATAKPLTVETVRRALDTFEVANRVIGMRPEIAAPYGVPTRGVSIPAAELGQTPEVKPELDWIERKGDDVPDMPLNSRLQVRLRNDQTAFCEAHELDWTVDGRPTDVVAWRRVMH